MIFNYSECKINADDVKIYKSVNNFFDVKQLQDDLSAFQKWCTDNCLFLNIEKCKVINFTRGNNTLVNSYKLNDAPMINVNIAPWIWVFISIKN